MNRLLASLSLLALLTPQGVQAATPLYGTATSAVSNQVYQPENVLGAPDSVYLTFFAEEARITIDLGATATGPATLHYQLLNFGSKYLLEYLNADMGLVTYTGATLNLGTETTAPVPNGPYRYLRITNDAASQWKLDAVSAVASTGAPAPTPTPSPAPESPLAAGALIKLADDGNASTTVDSAVYTLGSDGKRHAFPAESVFYSWYTDFSGVKIVSAEKMASYPLGKNVTIRPGTKLVKIQTDPKTYAVSAGGTLRWIPTEALAISLFGANWATKVVDVADTFFGNYVMGPDLSSLDSAPSMDPNMLYPY